MKKRIIILGIAALFASFNLFSCNSDDDFGVEVTQNSVLILNFKGENVSKINSLKIEIIETNTGTKQTVSLENQTTYSLELPYGSYNIIANGLGIDNNGDHVAIAGGNTIVINTLSSNLTIDLLVKQFGEDFIIEEVFFTGIKTAENKNYNNSRYFKITNNTEKVLYADNLIIATSEFFTTTDQHVTPFHPNEAFAISAIMTVPGSGTEHPVQPGDFIVVADNAIDHTEFAPDAYNLINADFEFPNENPSLGQVDNPNVPNMNIIYTKMNYNMIFLYTTSQESYVIARFPEGQNAENFLENNKYNYSYTNAAGNVINRSSYQIPNSWIIDGVNVSNPDKFLRLITSKSIDSGWTGAWPGYNGKTIRRKEAGKLKNGKTRYQDTNNSTEDFIANSDSSLANGIVH